MKGKFALFMVNFIVMEKSPGAYILSRDGKTADYVGRSDTDLTSRIKSSAKEGSYSYFWFEYASSPRQAYLLECEWWHRFNPPDNLIHPDVPNGTYWRCPNLGCVWSHV